MRGRCASAAGSSTPGAQRIVSGAQSSRMWPSSRSPAFGLMGTAATPASSAPMTATAVSGADTAHTPTRSAPATSSATWAAASRSCAIGQLHVAEAQGEAVVGVAERGEEHVGDPSTHSGI